LGESDARHCHRPGTWQMGVHHDLSPSGLGAAGDRRVRPLLWPHGTSTVLGIDLKCSESGLATCAFEFIEEIAQVSNRSRGLTRRRAGLPRGQELKHLGRDRRQAPASNSGGALLPIGAGANVPLAAHSALGQNMARANVGLTQHSAARPARRDRP
jgi:hypothetical protein